MNLFADILICLRFFSRLPVPETERERLAGPRGVASAAVMASVAGAILGLLPAGVLLEGNVFGLPPFLSALLALVAMLVLTGAMHEDALADCADGFGGGRTREAKLAIMRDSQIGAYGASAIVLALMLRAGALAALVAHAPRQAAAVAVGAAALSRGVCLLPLVLLPPARTDGAGAAAAAPDQREVAIAIGLGVVVLGLLSARPLAATIAVALAVGAVLFFCRLALRQIQGQTGDVAGAAQQIAEIVILVVMTARPAGLS